MAPSTSVHDFLDFVDASPSPYHAVAECVKRLEQAGFQKILERNNWDATVKPGGIYYLTRNASSLVAFTVGKKWQPCNPIAMVGAHTDSPCLRIKPVSKKSAAGYLQVGVETYGGGIWHSWFDRDLGVAGRIFVREGDAVRQKLVNVDKPILRIPHLAIHLHRNPEFNPNKETELLPIASLVEAELNKTPGSAKDHDEDKNKEGAQGKHDFLPLQPMSERHHASLVDVIAQKARVDPSKIVELDLVLYDTQKACLGGLRDDFIYSARLDNLNSTFCAIQGLISSVKGTLSLEADPTIRLVCCFDHEEVGSQSAQGAQSNLLPAILRRLSVLPGLSSPPATTTAFEQTLSTSFLISADMAHAVHPNYEAKYEGRHAPAINGGPVIKVNANQRYATNTPGITLLHEVARRARVPLQLFVVRNDSPCGSTIGPMLSAALGSRTLDLGNPQLAMHSIRETGGTQDVDYAIRLFDSFFTHYGTLEGKMSLD